ncbi:MAG: fluoride efflux transporter CrcB [Desulfovibrionaceae bacterium]|nr:fluoride efflux transporter CrcB [Desulfovibrionaceae bacterium]MBF0514217.1 fluoride efflux transporter CrcB [Desulfovibrionaceae bacterium]
MQKILLLALAGVAGTLARYYLSGAVHDVLGREFPFGTAAVNLLGCALFGLVWTLADERALLSPQARIVILVGFMGAFTTFSSFIYESAGLIRDQEYLKAAVNIVGQNVLGYGCFILGAAFGRVI